MELNKLSQKSILVIEDDIPMADLICYSLNKEGFIVKSIDNGCQALNLIENNNLPDLIILDINLPDINGLDICKKIMASYFIPVILLTAKDTIIDKVRGFESGADDYITKPFDLLELTFRVKAVLRRSKSVPNKNLISVSKTVLINADERKVFKNDEVIDLTLKEFELLMFLIKNKGKVLSREQILDRVWGMEFYGDTRTVDNHIKTLRKKLDDKSEVSFIETVYGVGYLISK